MGSFMNFRFKFEIKSRVPPPWSLSQARPAEVSPSACPISFRRWRRQHQHDETDDHGTLTLPGTQRCGQVRQQECPVLPSQAQTSPPTPHRPSVPSPYNPTKDDFTTAIVALPWRRRIVLRKIADEGATIPEAAKAAGVDRRAVTYWRADAALDALVREARTRGAEKGTHLLWLRHPFRG